MNAVWWVVIVVVVIVVATALLFNGMVRRRNRTNEAWSQIDVELKRRHDLIPRLVSTVEGYAAHERSTFDSVTTARASAVAAGRQVTVHRSRQPRTRSEPRCGRCSPLPRTTRI